jgi:ABC-type branched-subunit amino acid transport system substrate-binding protein
MVSPTSTASVFDGVDRFLRISPSDESQAIALTNATAGMNAIVILGRDDEYGHSIYNSLAPLLLTDISATIFYPISPTPSNFSIFMPQLKTAIEKGYNRMLLPILII